MEISPVQELRALKDGTVRATASVGVMVLSTARLAVAVVQAIATVYIVTFTTARKVAEKATERSTRGVELDLFHRGSRKPEVA